MNTNEARALLDGEVLRLEATRLALQHDSLTDETQRSATAELSGSDQHLADVATETFDREVELGLLSTVAIELREVSSALARLERGEFGRCLACGSPIPDDRLRAVPSTAYCLDHQAAAEAGVRADEDSGCSRFVETESLQHLDLLADDDEVDTDRAVGAEQLAMHVVDPLAR